MYPIWHEWALEEELQEVPHRENFEDAKHADYYQEEAS